MSTGSNTFKYQAILRITYNLDRGEIEHIFKEDEILKDKFEVFYNSNEDYKIFACFSCENGRGKLKSLILEKTYYQTQDEDNFHDYAKNKLLALFNKIKFVYSSFPQNVNHSIAIKTPNEKSFVPASGIRIGGSAEWKLIDNFNKSKYENLCKINDFELDEYIDSYLLIQQFRELELRLISSYRLHELIGEHISSKGIKYKEINGTYYKYFENRTGQAVLEIEMRACAARNLISHGLVSQPKTVKELNIVFGTPDAKTHKFNRRNPEHIKLIEYSADRFLAVIYTYLKNLL